MQSENFSLRGFYVVNTRHIVGHQNITTQRRQQSCMILGKHTVSVLNVVMAI